MPDRAFQPGFSGSRDLETRSECADCEQQCDRERSGNLATADSLSKRDVGLQRRVVHEGRYTLERRRRVLGFQSTDRIGSAFTEHYRS